MTSGSWRWLGATAVVAIVAATGGYELSQRRRASGGMLVAATPGAVGTVLYWYDPMYPQQHFDKPGKSPFMDMQLVPRQAGESAGVGTSGVRIPPQVLQNLGVRLATVEKATLDSRIDATGVLSLNDRDVAVVQSRAAGFVERVWPLAPGDQVSAGDPLVELLTPEWAAAEREFLAVRSSGDAGLVEASRERLRLLGIDDAVIRKLEADGAAQSRYIVRAPIGGVVQTLDLRPGMTVMQGQTVLRINGLNVVWLDVAVPESLAASVQVGDHADVRFGNTALPPLAGKVAAVLPVFNEAARTLRVRVELANLQGALRPGQSAQVTLSSLAKDSALAVPTEAVIRTGKRALVLLAERGSFRPLEVQLGQEIGDRTVITSGLSEGQQVVASGQFLLDSEASLRGMSMPAMEEGK